MGFWGSIKSVGHAVSGSVSSVAHHATSLADPRKALRTLDPRHVAGMLDPRKIQLDPRKVLKGVAMGRLPGASTIPGASSLMPGAGLSLKDRIRVSTGNPEAIAKSILTTASQSTSSKWAPRGFARGLGPTVANIASLQRAGQVKTMTPMRRIVPKFWF